jgi:hypothetical protein
MIISLKSNGNVITVTHEQDGRTHTEEYAKMVLSSSISPDSVILRIEKGFLEVPITASVNNITYTSLQDLQVALRFFFSLGGSGGGGTDGNFKGGWSPKTNTPDIYEIAKEYGDFVVVENLNEDETFSFDFGNKGGVIQLNNNDRVYFNGVNYIKNDYLIPDASEIPIDRTDPIKGSVLEFLEALNTGLATEITNRTTADTALSGQIALKANATALTQEVTDRTNADTALSGQIALKANATALTQEVTDRTNADTALSGQIALKANATDLTQEVTDRTNADTALSGQIALKANTTALTQEVTDRTNADTSIRNEFKKYIPEMQETTSYLAGNKVLYSESSNTYHLIAVRNTTTTTDLSADLGTGDWEVYSKDLLLAVTGGLYPKSTVIQDAKNGNNYEVLNTFTFDGNFKNTNLRLLEFPRKIEQEEALPIGTIIDGNNNYNLANGFSVGSYIYADAGNDVFDKWIYLEEQAGIPTWQIESNVEFVNSRTFLEPSYPNGTVIQVNDARGLPDANGIVFTIPVKANYIIDDTQPLFDIRDDNGVIINSLPIKYLSAVENPGKTDADVVLQNQILGAGNQKALNEILAQRGDVLSNRNQTSLNVTLNVIDTDIAITSSYTGLANEATVKIDVVFSGSLSDNSVFEFDLSSLGTCSNINGYAWYSDDSKARAFEGIVVPSTGNKFKISSNGDYWRNGHPVNGVSTGDAIQINLKCTVTEWTRTSQQYTKALTAGTNIVITETETEITINSTAQGGASLEDQGLKVVSVNGNDTTGNGTYASPYKTINKALSIIKWNGIVEVQPSSGGATHNLSQIVIPADSNNPSVIHWNLTLDGTGNAVNNNRTELTFDNSTSNFISLPNTNVRFAMVDLNLDFSANQARPLVFGGSGGNLLQNLTFKNHNTPLTFDFSNFKSTSAFLYLRDLSLGAFSGNLKFRNIPAGISNITVYIQGQNSTNLSLDTTLINALNPTATLTIIYDKEVLLGQNSALLTPTTLIVTNEIKDIYGFVANSAGLLTQNYTGLYILSANITGVGNKGDVVYLIKTGTNTSILGGNVRTYYQCPNSFSNTLTGVTYFKDAGYWVGLKESGTPVGTVMSFYGTTAPAGYLMLNGNTLTGGKTTYATLWAFAVANNITTTNTLFPALFVSLNATDFRIPDFRGYFLRGLGGIDPDVAIRPLGSVQADAFKSHNHSYYYPIYGVNGINPALTNTNYVNQPDNNGTTSNVGGAETRPFNIAVNYIIKF